MAGLLQTLSASYDYIFLDAPPINVVADSLMFLDKTAGAILVARQKQTHYDELQKAAESIRQPPFQRSGGCHHRCQRNQQALRHV